MATCKKCGKEVTFKIINGRPVPLHLDGSCSGSFEDYSGFNVSNESTSFVTDCPRCSSEVLFIRHNGGSVWIDPPPGPPWYKHPCFEKDEQRTKPTLLSEYELDKRNYDLKNHSLGIVKSTRVDNEKAFTDITLETDALAPKEIRLKNNAGFLLGRLCVYDNDNNEVWPIDEPSFIFIKYAPNKKHETQETNKTLTGFTTCPICEDELKQKNLEKHLWKQHRLKLKHGH